MAREAEVADRGALAAGGGLDEDVARFDVAVNQPGGVGGIESLRDLLDDRERTLRVERAFLAQHLPEVAPADVLHREIQDAVRLSRRERPDQVRAIERRGDARLAQETGAEPFVPGDRGVEHLQRHPRASLQVERDVDRTRCSLREERLEPETPDVSPDDRIATDSSVTPAREQY